MSSSGDLGSATRAQLIDSVAATTSIRDRDSLDQSIARLLCRFVGAHSVTLFRLVDDGHAKQLVRRAVASCDTGDSDADLTGRGDEASDLASTPGWQECIDRGDVVRLPGAQGRALTLFPIPGEREPVGLLAIDAGTSLTARESDLVRGILRIFRNHLALLDYGELDTLTGLLNRKTFEAYFDKLRQLLLTCVGHRTVREPSWLALLDIDRFKSINDGHGHLVGDEILLLVSQRMKSCFRGADQLFRFGGEEFLVILDQASDAGAMIAIERLRAAVEEHVFPQIGRVTLSAGYTRLVAQDIPTTCVERADAALYYAKAHGRNRVCNYEVLVATGKLAGRNMSGGVDLF